MKTPWYQSLTDSPRKRLVLALLVAALFSDVFSVQPYRRCWRALKAIFGLLARNEPRVDADRLQRRNDACERCPYRWPILNTCGSPLRKDLSGKGCYCNLDIAAQLADKQCWIDEIGDTLAADGFGWSAAERRYWASGGDAARALVNR